MKKLIYTLFLLPLLSYGQPTIPSGKVVVEYLNAPSLQNNPAGENPVRRLSIYLPPGYEEGKERYPVLYYLHANDLCKQQLRI